MLPNRSHWHFAQKLYPERERRLLWLSATPNNTQGGNEDDAEKMQREMERLSREPENTVEHVIEGTAARIERVQELTARAAATSPFVLQNVTDILRRKDLQNVPGVSEFLRTSKDALDTTLTEDTRLAPELVASLEQSITKLLDSPEVALAFTQAFEKRMERFHELLRTIGVTDARSQDLYAKVAQFDNEIQSSDKARVLSEQAEVKGEYDSGADAWTDEEVDAALKKLAINPSIELKKFTEGMTAEQKKTIEAVSAHTVISSEDSIDGKPTKAFKLRLLRRTVLAARQISVLKQSDLGGEGTLEDTTEMEQKLFKQLLHSRKHLERTVKQKAAMLRSKYEEFRKAIVSAVGSEEASAIAKKFYVAPAAVKELWIDTDQLLQRALQVAKDGEQQDALNLPNATEKEMTDKARSILDQLKDLEEMFGKNPEEAATEYFSNYRQDKDVIEVWAMSKTEPLRNAVVTLQHSPDVLTRISSIAEKDLRVSTDDGSSFLQSLEYLAQLTARIADGSATDDDRNFLYDFCDPVRRNRIDHVLFALRSPGVLTTLEKKAELLRSSSVENTQKERDRLSNTLANAYDDLRKSKALEHELCKALRVEVQLAKLYRHIQQKLTLAASDSTLGTQLIRECDLDIQAMQEAKKLTDAINDESSLPIVEDLEMKELGSYELTDNGQRIRLNPNAIADRARARGQSYETAHAFVVHHERGHAILNALSYQTTLIPGLLEASYQVLDDAEPLAGTSAWALLEREAVAWGFTEERRKEYRSKGVPEDRIAGREREDMVDELLNRYASWKAFGEEIRTFTDGEKKLFALLDGNPESASHDLKIDSEKLRAIERPSVAMHMTDEADMSAEEVLKQMQGQAEATDITKGVRLIGQEITDAQNDFMLLHEFVRTHQKIPGIEEYKKAVEGWETAFDEKVSKVFFDGGEINEPEIIHKLDKVKAFIKEMDKMQDEILKEELNTVVGAQGTKGGKGLMAIIDAFDYVSINDIIAMWKSAVEDIQRMWKRRGERVQSALGKRLTNWIPDNNIWGLSYLGQLKHEFERRNQSSELDEVKQWKDALGNMDSWDLQSLLENSRNRDQVRASVELLIERGRLDLNDVEFWRTLKNLSGMDMPEEACLASDILRDKWLQKMVTFIWSDKEKFFEWRQQNDSNAESGKKKFLGTVDQISNVGGGLSGALERQLMLWVNSKESGEKAPDEVNPHLYEEILHYSMRNGKMTMEAKLFYLVQGVRYKLITIDRLRILAGENGGVLNQFPFIDYFYQHHNSLPEMIALGRRMEEGDKDERFHPGPKTTLWLHLELLRDENARQRMSKATSGTRAEGLDHEDIPTIIAQGDYKLVERLTDIVSGSREKMSPEAAKNAYTGFGTKFRILGRLAELDQFTDADAFEAAKSIVAYIHFDNIVTRNGSDKDTRNELSWAELSQQGPSTGGHATSVYRNSNTSFVQEVMEHYDNQIDWKKLGKYQKAKSPEDTEKDMTLDVFMRKKGSTERRSQDNQKNVFGAIGTLQEELARVLSQKENRVFLKEMLKKHVADFREEIYFNQIDKNTVVDYLQTRERHGKNVLDELTK